MKFYNLAKENEKAIAGVDLNKFFAKKPKLAKLKVMEFFKDSSGTFSGTRVFAFILVFTTIADWLSALFTTGVWQPDWQSIGTVLGVLGFKFAQKMGK